MPASFGPGVSRTLSALDRQFQTVIWQRGKPPLDSELNLMSQIDVEALREVVRSQVHSGFLLDPTAAVGDYITNPLFSNQFRLGLPEAMEVQPIITAVVNGWVIPVAGTDVLNAANLVRLNPPPASDSRIDLVFLEAWVARVAPNPSTVNKPSASTIWRYGNVEYGGVNVPDDIQDPAIGFETSERVQVQYRLRVYGTGAGAGASVALDVYPDGLGDPNIFGQGAANTVGAFPFVNMRDALGDPSLWRAGNGLSNNNLGTVDGYTYAVPVCAVFRRNSSGYSTVEPSGTANQNGGFDRNAIAYSFPDPRDGARTLSEATLTNDIATALGTGIYTLTNLAGSGFDTLSGAQLAAGIYFDLDGEILGPITAVTATTITVSGRGRGGTMAKPHVAGKPIRFFNSRPDGLFADQIAPGDILDLRHGVAFGDWDYTRLLIHNLSSLVLNNLHTSYKQSATGETQGVQVIDVGYMCPVGLVPPSAQGVDGPDGIRTVFSDAATAQNDVTLMCKSVTATGADPALDTGVDWGAGAAFIPTGFFTAAGYANGSVIFLNIGGLNGVEGARATFRGGSEAVRFLAPFEVWKDGDVMQCGKRTAVTMRWIGHDGFEPSGPGASATAGPMYPVPETEFQKPFIVLGGTLNAASNVSAPILFEPNPSQFEVQLPGVDFDTVGAWWNGTDVTSLSTANITDSVLHGRRTMYDMLTRGGTDTTGQSSEVYLVLYGDTSNYGNNGVVRVIGAGTVGYTQNGASAPNQVRVEFVVEGVSTWSSTATAPTNAELRSQYTDSADGVGGSTGGPSSLAIIITDIEGLTATKWGGIVTSPENTSELVINTTLQYHPGHGAMPRVPDRIWDVAGVSLGSNYLRQSRAALDPTWAGQVAVPTSQTRFDYSHVGAWNRLPSLGLNAPEAPSYGGGVATYSEQTREAEVFLDPGSKTVVLRPFRAVNMTLYGFTFVVPFTLLGSSTYPFSLSGPPAGTPKDGAGIFEASLKKGYAVPPEFMPRFGRQDIPFHVGSDATFLTGINHLFTDTSANSAAVTNIVGGQDNGGTPGAYGVRPLYLQTGSTSGLPYCSYGATGIAGLSAYQGRLYYTEQVVSTDLGRGMRGIQLPPYLGTARIFGVYDRRDVVIKGGAMFEADRTTPSIDPATNLLRTDASQQTVFILQGGAQDVTGDAGDHTYIIPSDAIDITLAPTYVAGETFEDIEYVVVFAAFGFARGFINENNIVLARAHNGAGAVPTTYFGGTTSTVAMTLALPAVLNDPFIIGYTRTPYQGDPYMTRAGETRVVSDFQVRYGQVPVSDQYLLETPIQQFEPDGSQIPQTPNRRGLQILAAIEFYTTLGTGKIGGALYPGTLTDCGHTENSEAASMRQPATSTAAEWRIVPRTFTEPQPPEAPVAAVRLVIVDNTKVVANNTVTIGGVTLKAATGAPGANQFQIGVTAADTAANLSAAIVACADLYNTATSIYVGGTDVYISSVIPGAAGNATSVVVAPFIPAFGTGMLFVRPDGRPLNGVTATTLSGGKDIPINAGNGTSLLSLTGLSERLPLGILLQDSDFLCENPLADAASALATAPTGIIQASQTLLPLAGEAREYTPLLGGPGQWVALSDGGILTYTAYTDATPTGTKRFRLYRGGGSAFVVSTPTPGGPASWSAGSFPAALEPVLKGAVLACKAMLVRNLPEEAFSTPSETSPGDEVQMVILTYGIIGDGHTQQEGIELAGTISPTGYGEGFAAADRYRLEGRPMITARVHAYPNMDVEPAVYPVPGTGITTTTC